MENNKESYIYAVATCGNISRSGNSITQLNKLLKRKGITLNYAEHLDMFSNYLILYDMKETKKEEATMDIQPIIKNIYNRKSNIINFHNEPLQQIGYCLWMHYTPKMDKNFNVSDACIKCGICAKVCPINNIALDPNGKRSFKHHCEQCVGCIQACPKQAINYKNKIQDRGRYTHPDISWKELAKLNGYKDY